MNKVKLCIFYTLANLLIGTSLFAQDTTRINYQGIALNANSTPIANSTISVQTIIAMTTSNSAGLIYQESRFVQTDANGYFDFQIGSKGATSVTGDLHDIVYHPDFEYKMEIKIDPTGGSNYTSMGIQTLGKVPLAISSIRSDSSRASYSSVTSKFSSFTDSLTLPFKGNDATINSFIVENSYNGAGVAIIGRSYEDHINAVGIFGEVPIGNLNGSGVRGRSWSASAIGVEGVGISGIGIKGKSSGVNGVGVLAENTNSGGKALEVNGNVKISGGTTSPGAGKILTSDASGNATWKNPKIGFVASSNTAQNCPNQTITYLSLNEEYDGSGNFNPSTASTNPNAFIAPVSGLYHFTSYATLTLNSLTTNINFAFTQLSINGVDQPHSRVMGPWNSSTFSALGVPLSRDVHLNAGDVVKVSIGHVSGANLVAILDEKYFSGHLIYED